jgi:hypothetical protein
MGAYSHPLQVYLRDAGGGREMAVDGSIVPRIFFYQPPDNHVFEVYQVVFTLSVPEKTEPPTVPPQGTDLVLLDGEGKILYDWTDGERIFGAFDSTTVIGPPSAIIPGADKTIPTIYTFAWHATDATGNQAVRLRGSRNYSIRCVIRDELDHFLDRFNIMLTGRMYHPSEKDFTDGQSTF